MAKVINVNWVTDGCDVDIPKVLDIPSNLIEDGVVDEESVSDWLSDSTGWLHDGFMIAYTWDDLYKRADDKAWFDRELKAKDNARWNVNLFAVKQGKEDIEQFECPEDAVEDYCEEFDILFDEDGEIISHTDVRSQKVVMVVKYGYVTVSASTDKEALEMVRCMGDSDFNWSDFGNEQVVEDSDREN